MQLSREDKSRVCAVFSEDFIEGGLSAVLWIEGQFKWIQVGGRNPWTCVLHDRKAGSVKWSFSKA